MKAKTVYSVSVRDLASFVLRTGDLGGGGGFSGPNRAIEGTRGHQRVQKSRPLEYEPEVPVTRVVEGDEFDLKINGRIDGVMVKDGGLLIEEIKTVQRAWVGEADPLHFAQAKIYAAFYGAEKNFSNCDVQVTYLELDTGHTVQFREKHELEALENFFSGVAAEYMDWLRLHHARLEVRNASIQALGFPFGNYRAGQRELAVRTYRTIKQGGKLFAEAPTGIGKTVSVLFPAIKALGEGTVERIFYLTAKTVGRTVAEQTVANLRSHGLKLHAVTLTAKDKACFNDGQACDMARCPYAIGYYDRIKSALKAGFKCETLGRHEIEEVARAHQVCPFELSLDLSSWADALICDYNYAFDPSASLKRHFGEEERDYALLIDEAHNLADRAREMFSAELKEAEILELKSRLNDPLPECGRALAKISRELKRLAKGEGFVAREGQFVSQAAPEKLLEAVAKFLEVAELWLARNEPTDFRQELLDFYFQSLAFQRTSELFTNRYRTIYDPESGTVRLFCMDPSELLGKQFQRVRAAILFSATLTPIEYFVEALGGVAGDGVLRLNSPFDSDNLRLLVHEKIQTTYQARAGSYGNVAEAIAAFVSGRTGNYLVFFPSYQYLREVLALFQTKNPEVRVMEQKTGMTEGSREEFLTLFEVNPSETLVGFAVMGGIFGEGIDLAGDRLIGVAVVGVGLPQLCLERDLICEFHQEQGRFGFDFAYTFPGMNRVLQAAGRVIRSENDRGTVLLIDGRFGRGNYRRLFPGWWKPRSVRSDSDIAAALKDFWNTTDKVLA